MGSIILEVSFLLYKVMRIDNIQETIQTAIEKFNITNYYLDFEIENRKRLEEKGLYTIHFEDNIMSTSEILKFLRNIKKIPHVNLECIYRDNITCDIIYASKFYVNKMDKKCQNDYYNKKTRRYSESDFEILNGIQKIFKKNKNYFKNEAPKSYEEYLKLCC